MKLKGKAKKAFLARMARGRNKKHHHKKHKKHHTGGAHVAKRRRHHTSKKSKGKRRHHSGGMGKWLPDQHKLVSLGTSFAYGKVEAAASKDNAHFLNKVPNIIAQIGKAGNLGTILWVASRVIRKPIVADIASGVLHVAAYQNGRQTGGFSKDKAEFTLSGPGNRPGRGPDEMKVEEYLRRRGGGGFE
jgi:hypothetical protein